MVGSRRRAWRCAYQLRQVLCSTSKSANSTLRPTPASATAVERASVDFPTPPFWEVKRMWRAMGLHSSSPSVRCSYPPRRAIFRIFCHIYVTIRRFERAVSKLMTIDASGYRLRKPHGDQRWSEGRGSALVAEYGHPM